MEKAKSSPCAAHTYLPRRQGPDQSPFGANARFKKTEGPIHEALRQLTENNTPTALFSASLVKNRANIPGIEDKQKIPERYRGVDGLLLAVKENNLDVARCILTNADGLIDVNYRDPRTGDTAWGVARRQDNHEMMNLLKPALNTVQPCILPKASSPRASTVGCSGHDAGFAPDDAAQLKQPLPHTPIALEIPKAYVTEAKTSPAEHPVRSSEPQGEETLPETYRGEMGGFAAIADGNAEALGQCLALKKFAVNRPNPSTGMTPLITAVLAGKSDMVGILIAAGADAGEIDKALQDPAAQFVPIEYRGQGGRDKALQDGRIDVLAVACHFAKTRSNEGCETAPVATPIAREPAPSKVEATPSAIEQEVKSSTYFHRPYNASIEESLLPSPGMYLFRDSSSANCITLTYRDKNDAIRSMRLSFQEGKIKIGHASFDNIQDILNKALEGTKNQVGIKDPQHAYNALPVDYKFDNGILLALGEKDAEKVETIILNKKGFKFLDHQSGGKTALTFALETRNARLARLIIDCDANVTLADSNGDTPLHIAARTNQFDMIELLCHHGVSFLAENKLGQKPSDVAGSERARERVTLAAHNPEETDYLSGDE
jgi:ankyrin repeat protein